MNRIDHTPVALRTRISVFGRRNAGKSSLVNAIASQRVSIVSAEPGTTTDPVSKTMEILPLGPCVVTDTAGLDDAGETGAKRVEASLRVLDSTDVALVAVPCGRGLEDDENAVLRTCGDKGVRAILVRTKSDMFPGFSGDGVKVSSVTGEGVEELKNAIGRLSPDDPPRPLVADLAGKGDMVLCVCPVDAAAPKGRLILPQQQTVRELIECGAAALVCQPDEIPAVVAKTGSGNIKFAITDSQAFAKVDALLPQSIPLTSFSILFARLKGDLETLCKGAAALKKLEDGDVVMVSEGCTHHRQCGDIGAEKIPRWLEEFTGRKLKFVFSSGNDFPLDGSRKPKAIVHCGACMLSRRAFASRMEKAVKAGIPIVNYGVAIAAMHGIAADPRTAMVARRKIDLSSSI